MLICSLLACSIFRRLFLKSFFVFILLSVLTNVLQLRSSPAAAAMLRKLFPTAPAVLQATQAGKNCSPSHSAGQDDIR
jgi:hypothetical protein